MTSDQQPVAGSDPQAALSRELSDFLIQLSIGLHRYAMYPAGHPSLAPTVDKILDDLTGLLQSTTTLSLGVARNQLVIEGVATDPKNPVLKDLASRLHRHQIGAVTFKTGAGHAELHELLRAVAVDPDRSGAPIGLDPAYREDMWSNVRVYPLTYDRLRLLGDQASEDETEESRSARTRAAQLWVGLARAAMAAEQAKDGDAEVSDEVDPTVVAKAIESHQREAAYDQVIVGYMLQIADELKTGKNPESATLRKRISSLVSNLDQNTLGNLMEMGGDRNQRRQFLLSASEGMAVDAVVDLVRAASETQEQTISHSMLRMLQKMARHAEVDGGRRRREAETSVREQVASLVHGWSLTDPNPDEYRLALQRMSTAKPVFAVAPDQRFLPEAERLFQMALELDVVGEAVQRAVEKLAEQGRQKWMIDQVGKAQAPEAGKLILDRVASPEEIARLLEHDPVDANLLDRQLKHVGLKAADVMLDALVRSESSHTRRLLISRLIAMGSGVGPHVAKWLTDERWYVKRNMLALLSELPELPAGFSGLDYLDDPDSRVRREALRILLRDEGAKERAICVGLADADDHNVRLALTAAARNCPEAAIPLLVSRATGGTNRDQRVTAIKVLGTTGNQAALETLIQIVTPRKALFGMKHPNKTPEYLAALAAVYPHGEDPRVREALAVAARSRDTEIARTALGERRTGAFEQL